MLALQRVRSSKLGHVFKGANNKAAVPASFLTGSGTYESVPLQFQPADTATTFVKGVTQAGLLPTALTKFGNRDRDTPLWPAKPAHEHPAGVGTPGQHAPACGRSHHVELAATNESSS